ncbi:hypothetical protein TRIUR3_27489 [Triticum urartu]|uniref:Late embryogenesis abundant protein LEA-2 subgroup domain-containing protein n=1 Tax=Triticum urartu TaxID=4572 RepID=M7ZRL4_TRIUA|nr:hypothetical protein TRIUR3_27489 [Triticum urartu]
MEAGTWNPKFLEGDTSAHENRDTCETATVSKEEKGKEGPSQARTQPHITIAAKSRFETGRKLQHLERNPSSTNQHTNLTRAITYKLGPDHPSTPTTSVALNIFLVQTSSFRDGVLLLRARHNRCCRCVCCTLLVLIVLVVALGATAGILYAVFRPKIPTFRVERLTATRFDVNTTSMTVSDAFEVQVITDNPNRRIGVYYDGGWVAASFNGTELCRGAFPALYQGHRSTVRPLITLQGARVPIRIKFGALKLWTMTGKARCSLVVDSLEAGTRLRIRSNSCTFKLKPN